MRIVPRWRPWSTCPPHDGSLTDDEADPGETVTVGILIPERVFQHWSGGGWALEAGTFTLSAGSSSASLPLTASVTLK